MQNRMTLKFWVIAMGVTAGCQSDTAQNHMGQSSQSACLTDALPPIIIPSGLANIGNNKTYPEEAPARQINVQGFDIDATEVTNAQFSEFINATGYITDAQKPQEGFDVPGGAVFRLPTPTNPSWWHFVEGANWQYPEGPDSPILGRSIKGREHEPVVQVSIRDARAYAKWAGRRLPTEVEWEYAAQAGADTLYVWGEERTPHGKEQANTWQGPFPVQNSNADGFERRAPVGCFKPNAFGLYDMIGNVWEWTDTAYETGTAIPQQVIKGGSFLCSENYCRRYRASARQPHEADFTTNHIGFRTVKSLED